MRYTPISILAVLAFMAALSNGALAGAAPEEALSLLQKRGYSNIEIEPGDAPGYRASACKGGTRFSVTLDAKSNIVDVDPVGNCHGAPRTADAGRVEASTGKAGKGDAHVRAPFADVRVGPGGVHIRAPFVNLKIQ